MQQPPSEDYYATLGVSPSASAAEIKAAFRKLARELHPDVNKAEDASASFQTLNEAYGVLGDEAERRKYDETYQPAARVRAAAQAGQGHDRTFWSFEHGQFHGAGQNDGERWRKGDFASFTRQASQAQQFDFEEWNRMHYGGPSDEALREHAKRKREERPSASDMGSAGRAAGTADRDGDDGVFGKRPEWAEAPSWNDRAWAGSGMDRPAMYWERLRKLRSERAPRRQPKTRGMGLTMKHLVVWLAAGVGVFALGEFLITPAERHRKQQGGASNW